MRWLCNYSHRGHGVFGKATLVSKRKITSLDFAQPAGSALNPRGQESAGSSSSRQPALSLP